VRPGVRCPTGEARITPGFDLPARYIIHTVGPVWRGGDQGEPELLAACYRNSLLLAQSNGVKSIAFPAVSCGVYGYPPDAAAQVAVGQINVFFAGSAVVSRALLVAFDDEVFDALGSALA
jgi:O-acetyl-ADP-ribose deacetylase (regulator of RNase III)